MKKHITFQLVLISVILFGLTQAEADDAVDRGYFKCRNTAEEKAIAQHNSNPPVENTTKQVATATPYTMQLNTTEAGTTTAIAQYTSNPPVENTANLFTTATTYNMLLSTTETGTTAAIVQQTSGPPVESTTKLITTATPNTMLLNTIDAGTIADIEQHTSNPPVQSTTEIYTTAKPCTILPNTNEAGTTIQNGSFLVNANCTGMYNCTNGNMSVNDEYRCNSNAICETRDDIHQCYCSNGYHGNGENCTQMTNCLDLYIAGLTTNGIYSIKPTNWSGKAFEVFCNMTDGGGWTVFQRRVNGSVDFYRNWASYKEGFGELDHEFWLGNDKLYYLTNQGNYSLRIDLVNRDGAPYYAKYDLFRINDESDNYQLSDLGTYNGTADERDTPDGEALQYHKTRAFSTHDRDNDRQSNVNCGEKYHGAWWYKGCLRSNLNGDYDDPDNNNVTSQRGISITWYYLPGCWYNIRYTEMKIRPYYT